MTPNTFRHSRAVYDDRSGWIATFAIIASFALMLAVCAVIEDFVLVAR